MNLNEKSNIELLKELEELKKENESLKNTYLNDFVKYKQFENEDIGIIPFNTGEIGGSLLFVMKQ